MSRASDNKERTMTRDTTPGITALLTRPFAPAVALAALALAACGALLAAGWWGSRPIRPGEPRGTTSRAVGRPCNG